MPTLALRADTRTQPTLSPQLQRAVRLLQMSTADFAQALREVVRRNPFLESAESDEEELPGVVAAVASPALHFEPTPGLLPPAGDLSVEHADRGSADDGPAAGEPERWSAEFAPSAARGAGAADEDEPAWIDRMPAETSLAMHLLAQLQPLRLSERDRWMAEAIVASLDDDGYLRAPLDDLLPDPSPLDPPPAPEEWRIALRRVQALEPAGVAARDVAECLRLQLPAIACARERTLAARVIDRHLPVLARRDAATLARLLRCSPAQAERVGDCIRRLDPRPGWRHGSRAAPYVVPDVVVKRQRGRWTVALNPATAPRVRLHEVYAAMYQRSRQAAARAAGAAEDGSLAEQLHEARWTVRNVEQRCATILGVAEEIVRRQQQFFELGAPAMKPMALRDVAEPLGLHESTVSRVTNNKYIATPLGTFELKHFFSRTMTGATGHEYSGTAIRGLVQDLIAAERPETPLSDVEITRRLARQGVTVARRTVTKYRQALKIEPVERRRRVSV